MNKENWLYNLFCKVDVNWGQTEFKTNIQKLSALCLDRVKKSVPNLIKGIIILAVLCAVASLPLIIKNISIYLSKSDRQETIVQVEKLDAAKNKLKKEIAVLNRKLESKTPKSYYLIINSSSNEFMLNKGSRLIKKDKCSTGSYVLLKNADEQEWMFKTPKGEFKILGKTTSPVWKKPDWAFVEDGLPVPTTNHGSRFEYGVLGDYALSLGHGYLIHGTLYQRFLGLPVTHGCIRLGDENLELVYKSLSIGSKVYIF